LTTWGLSDHVRANTTWLPEYIRMVRRLRVAGCRIQCGVEVKLLDRAGRLDLPPGSSRLDYLLIADHQFPDIDGPVNPARIRADLASGARAGGQVIEQLIAATMAAIRNSPVPPIVAHLFSILPKCGLNEIAVTEECLHLLAQCCLSCDAAIEVNEKWRGPSVRVVDALSQYGVRLVSGSDAHRPDEVGRQNYLATLDSMSTRYIATVL
jgi:putative hydrolase